MRPTTWTRISTTTRRGPTFEAGCSMASPVDRPLPIGLVCRSGARRWTSAGAAGCVEMGGVAADELSHKTALATPGDGLAGVGSAPPRGCGCWRAGRSTDPAATGGRVMDAGGAGAANDGGGAGAAMDGDGAGAPPRAAPGPPVGAGVRPVVSETGGGAGGRRAHHRCGIRGCEIAAASCASVARRILNRRDQTNAAGMRTRRSDQVMSAAIRPSVVPDC